MKRPPCQPDPGTRITATVASFRTWRSLPFSIAGEPAGLPQRPPCIGWVSIIKAESTNAMPIMHAFMEKPYANYLKIKVYGSLRIRSFLFVRK